MWFLRDSGFPRICPPQRSGSSAPAAATPDRQWDSPSLFVVCHAGITSRPFDPDI
jgi:hypothetical protein